MSANIEASLRLEIAQYQAAMAKARGDMTKLKEHAKREGVGIGGNLFNGLRSGFGGLLPAAGAAVIVSSVRSVLNEMDDLADTALKLNESTETLQRVEHASKILAGVDLGGLTTSFLRLEKSIGDVENAAGNKALERYGVTAESLTRLPLDQKIIVIAEAFQAARADGTGYNDLLALLGKSAGDLIPLLEQSSKTLKETFADAIPVGEGAVQQMAAMNDQIDAFISKQKGSAWNFLGKTLMEIDDLMKGNPLGTNQKEAGVQADKTVADQQKKRDAKADELAKALAGAKAAAALKEQLATQAEINKLAEKDAALGDKRFQDYLSILPPNLKLLELRRELMRLDEDRGIQGPGLEEDRIKNEEQILGLLGQIRTAEKEIGDEAKRVVDEEARSAKEKGGQDDALQTFEAEMALIDARLAKDKDRTAELERQAEIQQIQNQLIEDAGLSEAEALRRATERVNKESDLKKQLAKEKDSRYDENGKRADGRHKIDASIKGDATDARQRAEDRGNVTRDRTTAKRDKMGDLEGEDARLKGRFQKEFGRGPQPGGLDDQARKNAANGSGLANQAQKNAAKDSPPGAGDNPQQQAAQQVIALMTQILESVK